jgi:hypothetical protein
MPRRLGGLWTLRIRLRPPGTVAKRRPFISSGRGGAHTGETVLVPRFVSGWLSLVGNFDELPVILLEGSVQFAALSGNGGAPTQL